MDDELSLKVSKVTEAYDSFVLDNNLMYTSDTKKIRQTRKEREQQMTAYRATTRLMGSEEDMVKKRRIEME